MCLVEDFGNGVHAVFNIKARGRFGHQLAGTEYIEELRAEHQMTYVVQIDLAHKASGTVDNGEDVILGVGHLTRDLSQCVVGAQHLVVVLDDRVH